MRHLGNRTSELVDGRLTDARRERAHRHLATCDPCRREVERERQTRDLLAGLNAREPQPSAALHTRLLDLSGPEGPLPPPRARSVGVPPPPQPVPWQGSRAEGSSRGRRRLVATGASLTGAAAVLAVLAVIGGAAEDGRGPTVVVPDPASITVQHDRSTSHLPFNEPISILVPPAMGSEQGP